MKRYLTIGIILGILVAIIVTISWFAFPAWRDPASGGFLTLLGATFVGVLAFIQGGVSIWKDLKEEKEKKGPAGNVEQHGETNVSASQLKANQIGGYNVTAQTVNIYEKEQEHVPNPPLLSPEGWHLAHPYPMQPNFTGRTEERKILSRWLNEDTENHLLVIRALGGFGKSALAWHWLTHDVGTTQWSKVVWWSFYEGDASFENFVKFSLESLKIEVLQGERNQVDQLLKTMNEQKILLIMDGFERALRAYSSMTAAYEDDEEPPQDESESDCVDITAEHFLRSVCVLPNLQSKVLVTTRLAPRALEKHGQILQGCQERELEALDEDDAIAFFDAQGILGTSAEIKAVCEPYGYHPLSLRLLSFVVMEGTVTLEYARLCYSQERYDDAMGFAL